MKESPSGRKDSQTVRDKIAMILSLEISDPRVSMVTVTDARVSKDRSVCNIYVSTNPDDYERAMAGLESAKGRIRSILGKSLGWRRTPDIRFMIDTVPDEAERIERAILDESARMGSISLEDDGQDG